jgi:hypothetical protein
VPNKRPNPQIPHPVDLYGSGTSTSWSVLLDSSHKEGRKPFIPHFSRLATSTSLRPCQKKSGGWRGNCSNSASCRWPWRCCGRTTTGCGPGCTRRRRTGATCESWSPDSARAPRNWSRPTSELSLRCASFLLLFPGNESLLVAVFQRNWSGPARHSSLCFLVFPFFLAMRAICRRWSPEFRSFTADLERVNEPACFVL